MLTLPTQQPTQQELAVLKAAAEAASVNWTSRAEYWHASRPPVVLALLSLIDAQEKKIAEQDAQLQAAYP